MYIYIYRERERERCAYRGFTLAAHPTGSKSSGVNMCATIAISIIIMMTIIITIITISLIITIVVATTIPSVEQPSDP